MSNIKQAVIPVAGYGTRWLPYTKAIEKCMVPILNRPLIDWIVEDCIKAGVEDIIFVVGKEHEQLKKYYSRNLDLEAYLDERGKSEHIAMIDNSERQVSIDYVVQDPSVTGYGTAVPVALVSDHIKDDGLIAILMGDDFVFNDDGSSELTKLAETIEQSGASGGLMAADVPDEQVSLYGVMKFDEVNGNKLFRGIVEKPPLEEAPSKLINISKYVVPKEFFDYAQAYMDKGPNESLGEYLLTDVVNDYLEDGNELALHQIEGKYLDGGNPNSWLESNNYIKQSLK